MSDIFFPQCSSASAECVGVATIYPAMCNRSRPPLSHIGVPNAPWLGSVSVSLPKDSSPDQVPLASDLPKADQTPEVFFWLVPGSGKTGTRGPRLRLDGGTIEGSMWPQGRCNCLFLRGV